MKLQLTGLHLDLPDRPLEMDVVLNGPVVGIWGPSGIGKTSVLEVITGLRKPSQGRLIADDQVWFDSSLGIFTPPRQRPIGYSPQDVALFPHLNVRENLLFGQPMRRNLLSAWDRRPPNGNRQPNVSDVIDLLEIGELLARPVPGLSGGERQRVALGRALLAPASLWILDEPLSNLDRPRRSRILGRLLTLAKALHRTILYVSHDKNEIFSWCSEVMTISPERQVELGESVWPENGLPSVQGGAI